MDICYTDISDIPFIHLPVEGTFVNKLLSAFHRSFSMYIRGPWAGEGRSTWPATSRSPGSLGGLVWSRGGLPSGTMRARRDAGDERIHSFLLQFCWKTNQFH